MRKQTFRRSSRLLRRFFSVQPIIRSGQIVLLSPQETHHLRHVIRLKPGDKCLVIDGTGHEAQARILRYLTSGASELVVETIKEISFGEEMIQIRVIQALASKGKIDYLIEKAQELGVYEFWPVETKRSGVRISDSSRFRVLARWQRKAAEAAKQSGALRLTKILPVQTFQEGVVKIPGEEEIVVFHPVKDAVPFREWIEKLKQVSGSQRVCNLFFGPEGGFSQGEIDFVKTSRGKSGGSCTIVSLGQTILRMDTAVLGVVSALKLLLEKE